MTPTVLYESIASICMSVIKPPYFAERPVTREEVIEILYRIMRFAEKFEEGLTNCPSRFSAEGETVRCRLRAGHTGEHESGNWEWSEEVEDTP